MRRLRISVLIVAVALCLCPLIAQAEFLGVKKVTEPIIFPVNGPIDTLGRQTLQYGTPDHPDSITVFTYLDDGTFIAWDSGGAAYACPGIDTTMRRGETQIWFNRKIHWIDGIPSDSNSYTLGVCVWVWEDGYYRETNASVQVVTDSLNQLYAVRDSVNLYDNAGRFNANAQEILDTLKTYDNAGRFQALVQQILDTLQTYDNAGRFQVLAQQILDTLQTYDSDTRSWGANLLKIAGNANGDDSLLSFLLNAYLNSGAGTARVRSDMVYYEGADDVDGNVQSEVEDGLTAQDVMLASDTTTIPDNIWGHGTRTLTSLSGVGVDATSISGSTAAADSLEALLLRALKSFDVGSIYGDTSAANNLDLAFDNVIDSTARLDLRQLRIAMPGLTGGNPPGRLEPALMAINHAQGLGGLFQSDSSVGMRVKGGNGAGDDGMQIQSGTGTAASNALELQALSTGGSDALFMSVASGQTNSSKIIDMVGNNAGNSSVTGIQIDGVGSTQGIFITEGMTVNGQTYFDDLNLNNSLDATDIASNAIDSAAIAADAGRRLGRSFWAIDTAASATGGRTHVAGAIEFGDLNKPWASTSNLGVGPVSCTLDVRNASGGLGGVTVTVNNTSNVELYRAVSDANGFCFFNLDQSTTFRIQAGGLAGSIHDSLPYQTLVTTSATNKRDTVPMTTAAIPAPASTNLKRIYDDLYMMTGDLIQGALVIAELIVPDSTVIPYDTASGVSLGKNPPPVTALTNSAGRWMLDVIPNNYIRPAGTRYRFTVLANNRRIYSVTVTANGTTTALLRSLQ